MDTIAAVHEDAHDGDATVEHLRVVPIEHQGSRRPDAGDFVIYGGWALALLLMGVLLGLLPYLLSR